MTDAHETEPDQPSTSDPTAAAEKDPEEWVTGDEPMTGAQASYLATLARDTGREVPESATKAEASKLIDELRAHSPRAQEQSPRAQEQSPRAQEQSPRAQD